MVQAEKQGGCSLQRMVEPSRYAADLTGFEGASRVHRAGAS
jgi:hypothetical protein